MSRFILNIILLLSLIVTVLNGCSSPSIDDRLVKAESYADRDPKRGLMILDSINPTGLDKENHHYYDFLTIKLRDKAYITHTSDSLIKSVIEYASKKKNEHYAEALYYGGRVSYDMGDYPKALKFYHDAYNTLSINSKNKNLKGSIASQTGLLLIQLRLYEDAALFLEECIKLNIENGDSVNYFENMLLLGGMHVRSNNYRSAENILTKVINESKYENQKTKAEVLLAQTKYKQGDARAAMPLIRGKEEKVDSSLLSTALAYGALIYLRYDSLDTACRLAKRLIALPENGYNRNIGYYVLLSSELCDRLPKDTLLQYVRDYAAIVERRNNDASRDKIYHEEAFYNYSSYIKENDAIRKERDKIRNYLILFIGLAVIFGCVVIILIFRLYKSDTRLRDKESLYDRLESERLSLLDRIKSHIEENRDYIVSKTLTDSEPFTRLKEEYIEREKALPADAPLWNDIYRIVESESPDFKSRFEILTRNKHSESDYQTAILIRMGLSPIHMRGVLGLTKPGLISRRNKLGDLIYGRKVSTKIVDETIRWI